MAPTKRVIHAADHALDVITFYDRRSSTTASLQVEFLAQYQLEALLFRTHFNTTGAVYRLLKRAGVGSSALALRRASVADGLLSDAEFDQLKVLLDAKIWFNQFWPPIGQDLSSTVILLKK